MASWDQATARSWLSEAVISGLPWARTVSRLRPVTWRTGRRLPQKYYNASRDSCGNHFADVITMAATFESLRVVLGFAFREDVEDGIESMLLIDNRHLPVDLLGPPPAGYLIGRAMNRYELAAMCRALGIVLPDSLAAPLSNRRSTIERRQHVFARH